jgi:hypothetical protein
VVACVGLGLVQRLSGEGGANAGVIRRLVVCDIAPIEYSAGDMSPGTGAAASSFPAVRAPLFVVVVVAAPPQLSFARSFAWQLVGESEAVEMSRCGGGNHSQQPFKRTKD